jgi:hypothetical protein
MAGLLFLFYFPLRHPTEEFHQEFVMLLMGFRQLWHWIFLAAVDLSSGA